MKKTAEFYRYGIANGIYGVFDGADTLAEIKDLVKANYEDEPDIHIVRLDPETGAVKGLVICDFREKEV